MNLDNILINNLLIIYTYEIIADPFKGQPMAAFKRQGT